MNIHRIDNRAATKTLTAASSPSNEAGAIRRVSVGNFSDMNEAGEFGAAPPNERAEVNPNQSGKMHRQVSLVDDNDLFSGWKKQNDNSDASQDDGGGKMSPKAPNEDKEQATSSSLPALELKHESPIPIINSSLPAPGGGDDDDDDDDDKRKKRKKGRKNTWKKPEVRCQK